MLPTAEQAALKVFRDYQIAPGEMFCFTGPAFEKHQAALNALVHKDFVVKEQFSSGYSLTDAGYHAMVAACRP
jgi:hypothetical protein